MDFIVPDDSSRVNIEGYRPFLDFFNGTFLESFDALVTSDGSDVVMSIEKTGTGDLITSFSSGLLDYDTTPADTIHLTTGTDTSPQENFIYILQSSPTTLTKSTSNWPSAEHTRIGYFLVPSASLVNTGASGNNFLYVNQNWNDHTSDVSTNQGHMSHLTDRLRRLGAAWHSGAQGTATQDGNDLWVDITEGVVFQMHRHAFDSLNSDTDLAGDPILVINDPDATYTVINSLNEITKYSDGSAIGNNKYLKFVLWGVVNKSGEVSPMMLNLPSDGYVTAANAARDVDNFADFSIPAEFNLESSTGFLIAAFDCKHTATAMEIQSTIDLRGQTPNVASIGGGAVGGGDVTAAAVLTDNSIIRGDGGEKGVQDSGVLIDDSDNMTLPGLTAGSVVFAGAGGVLSQDNSDLFWDDTNKRLGIGTDTPGYILDIDAGEIGEGNYDGLRIVDTGWKATSHPMLEFYNSHASFSSPLARIYGEIGNAGENSKLYFAVADGSKNLQNRLVIDKDGNVDITGNIIVGGTVDGIDVGTDVAANTSDITDLQNRAHANFVAGLGSDLVGDQNLQPVYLITGSATKGWEMPYDGSILAISVNFTASVEVTPGDIRFNTRVGGANRLGVTIAINGTAIYSGYNTNNPGIQTFSAGDNIDIRVLFETFVGTIRQTTAVMLVEYDLTS